MAIVELSPPDMRRGDIVLAYGMRILLDDDPQTFSGHGDRTVYSWLGRVLNPDDEAVVNQVPRGWMHRDGIGQPRTEPRWNVQGNDLACFRVERTESTD